MKKLVLLMGLLFQLSFGMKNNQKISNLDNENIEISDQDINIYISEIKQSMLNRTDDHKNHIKSRWSNLVKEGLWWKNLTLEHVEDFISYYIDNNNTDPFTTLLYVNAMYTACQSHALHIDETLNKNHTIYYRKKIALLTFENFLLKRKIEKTS